ncbi:MAG: right-handed parallel beta-helix repeat-containing protein [Terrimicrobiaceae bacterium]|nr:right-handed parallel beta-helix repeat-containing protein [Terrimicrobiaceae bacterium]
MNSRLGSLPTRSLDLPDFRPARDAVTDDTPVLQRALDELARGGGGSLRVPAGVYRCSTLRVSSRTTLVLEPGSVLLAHDNPQAYQTFVRTGETGPNRWNRSMILCDGAEDVVITGGGVIDGAHVFDPEGEEKMRGPHTIMLHNCRRIRIEGIHVRNSANYAIMFYDSHAIDIRQVTVEAGWDGVHFRGRPECPCRDVTITDCRFHTGDDAIAGWHWENTVISGCVINSSCNGIRVIGPANGLIIQDCLIYGPGRHPHRTFNNRVSLAGILLQPGAWDPTEGTLDDVLISGVTMHRLQSPLQFVLKPGNRGGRITLNRVSALGLHLAGAAIESWADEPFGRVTFRDVAFEFESSVAESVTTGPVKEPHVGARALPAWALYARGVRQLDLEDVRFSIPGQPSAPALVCEMVDEIRLDRATWPHVGNLRESIRSDSRLIGV